MMDLTTSIDATYDTLRTKLPFNWDLNEPYDVVNPFGDMRRRIYHALWTFDIANNCLFHTSRDHRSRISPAVLGELTVAMADMESLTIPVPAKPTIGSETPYWKPQIEVDDRMRTFTHRALHDFDYSWRHILRNSYNSLTLRVLARATIRLSTLDFEIRECDYVSVTQLPDWEPFMADIVRVGGV
jgi:hypothetical protein